MNEKFIVNDNKTDAQNIAMEVAGELIKTLGSNIASKEADQIVKTQAERLLKEIVGLNGKIMKDKDYFICYKPMPGNEDGAHFYEYKFYEQ